MKEKQLPFKNVSAFILINTIDDIQILLKRNKSVAFFHLNGTRIVSMHALFIFIYYLFFDKINDIFFHNKSPKIILKKRYLLT